jgi:hypothetical protein
MRSWFNGYELKEKRNIMHNLINMVIQSHPMYEDIEFAVYFLQKSKSPSAIKLLNRAKPISKYGYEICALPERELNNGFEILLIILSKADHRRKNHEDERLCNHWWHKDLSNEVYVEELKRKFG